MMVSFDILVGMFKKKKTFYILVCMLGYNDWKKNSDSFRKLRNILNGEPEVNVLRISISTKYI